MSLKVAVEYIVNYSDKIAGTRLKYLLVHRDSDSRSSFSESLIPSCWYLRVTLTPERPSYNSCIVTVHLLPVHPAHPSQ